MTAGSGAREATLEDLIRPGMRVALGDGLGSPRSASAELSRLAAEAAGIKLILGWMPSADPGLDLSAFADVRALMSGWALRRPIDAGLVRALPVRLSTIPALLQGPLRPELLVATVVPVTGGLAFGTEVSWQQAAIAAGATVAGVLASDWPRCAAGPPIPSGQLVLVGEAAGGPSPLSFAAPTALQRALAANVASLVGAGSRIQVGPGALGNAVLDALKVPVMVDSGLLTDALVDLDERGMLLQQPVGTYLAGGKRLFEWADGRPMLHPIEYTHDPGRLSNGTPLIAVNTALEIDRQGQVNVEGTRTSMVGGIGGHPDYAAAAARSVGGLSIIALPTHHDGLPTLVDSLSRPVSTPSHDVDVLVTENGTADLRGLDRSERAAVIEKLWL